LLTTECSDILSKATGSCPCRRTIISGDEEETRCGRAGSTITFTESCVFGWRKLDLISMSSDLDACVHRSVDTLCIPRCSNYKFGGLRCRDGIKINDEKERIEREYSNLISEGSRIPIIIFLNETSRSCWFGDLECEAVCSR
jgi:hypothetical protein